MRVLRPTKRPYDRDHPFEWSINKGRIERGVCSAELTDIGIDLAQGIELRHNSANDVTVFLSHVKASFASLATIRIRELLKNKEGTESMFLISSGVCIGGLVFARVSSVF